MYLTEEDVFPGKVTIVDLGNNVITFCSPSHIQSICDAMEIPHIGTKDTNSVSLKPKMYQPLILETRWDFMVKRDGYSINLHPSPKLISSAFMALIQSFGWDSFTILYQV